MLFSIFIFLPIICLSVAQDETENQDDRISFLGQDFQNLDQEDERLIGQIKEKSLIPPFPETEKYELNLTMFDKNLTELRGQHGQPLAVENMFYHKDGILNDGSDRQRFFIEAGAYDGIVISNSLYLEMKHNWTGILVEPNPEVFNILKTRGRNAWLLNECLSTRKTPEIVKFDAAGIFGGIESTDPSREKPADCSLQQGQEFESVHKEVFPTHPDLLNRRTIEVQCLPLFSVLKAIGNPRVDYLSLDVEGSEVEILKTIPWDKVDISVIGVEVINLGKVFPEVLADLRSLLYRKGYYLHQKIFIDEFYVKRSLVREIKEKKKL